MNLHQTYCLAMNKLGNPHVKNTAKYAVYEAVFFTNGNALPALPAKRYFYIGLNGAVRLGETIATSRPVTERAKENLKALAK